MCVNLMGCDGQSHFPVMITVCDMIKGNESDVVNIDFE